MSGKLAHELEYHYSDDPFGDGPDANITICYYQKMDQFAKYKLANNSNFTVSILVSSWERECYIVYVHCHQTWWAWRPRWPALRWRHLPHPGNWRALRHEAWWYPWWTWPDPRHSLQRNNTAQATILLNIKREGSLFGLLIEANNDNQLYTIRISDNYHIASPDNQVPEPLGCTI